MPAPLNNRPIRLSPMLGMWDQYEPGSEMWAKALSMHFQHDYWNIRRDGSVAPLVQVLRVALNADPKPWEVWPDEANGNPEAWVRLITGDDWAVVGELLRHGDPEAWREISDALARWEVEHRKRGNPNFGKPSPANEPIPSATRNSAPDDDNSVRAFRRRLHRRASTGDEQAVALVEQLASGSISVNAAAIEAGMRARYLRVPEDDPVKAAASLLNRKGPVWAAALAARLTELLTKECPNA